MYILQINVNLQTGYAFRSFHLLLPSVLKQLQGILDRIIAWIAWHCSMYLQSQLVLHKIAPDCIDELLINALKIQGEIKNGISICLSYGRLDLQLLQLNKALNDIKECTKVWINLSERGLILSKRNKMLFFSQSNLLLVLKVEAYMQKNIYREIYQKLSIYARKKDNFSKNCQTYMQT